MSVLIICFTPMTYALWQLLIDICANYGIENDLLFNRSKSVCMVVKPRCLNVSTPLMFLNGDALEYVDSVKYLGVLLSQDMKDDADMSRHLRSFYARSNVIFRKFHHCSASIKVNLIKTYCAPYCSQLWVNHTKCSYNKLRVAYNNAYRRVLGQGWILRRFSGNPDGLPRWWIW